MRHVVNYLLGLSAAVLLLPALADQRTPHIVSVPSDLGQVDWSRTPNQVIADPVTGESVIWVGEIVSFKVAPDTSGNKSELEWVCRHLSYSDTTSEPVAKRPIRVSPGETGYFLVNLRSSIPTAEIEAKRKSFAQIGSYMLAAGKFHAVVERDGKQVVYLWTAKMEQADNLVTLEGRD